MKLVKRADGSFNLVLAVREAEQLAKRIASCAEAAHSPLLNFAFLLSESGAGRKPRPPAGQAPRPNPHT